MAACRNLLVGAPRTSVPVWLLFEYPPLQLQLNGAARLELPILCVDPALMINVTHKACCLLRLQQVLIQKTQS